MYGFKGYHHLITIVPVPAVLSQQNLIVLKWAVSLECNRSLDRACNILYVMLPVFTGHM